MSVADFIRNEICPAPAEEGFGPWRSTTPTDAIATSASRYRTSDTAVVDAGESSIEAREAAMLALASLGKPDHAKELLVYVPAKPPRHGRRAAS